jgi:hypothetical protein
MAASIHAWGVGQAKKSKTGCKKSLIGSKLIKKLAL